MFCTTKERETCNHEKMGCEGCYYNNNGNKITRKIDKRINTYITATKEYPKELEITQEEYKEIKNSLQDGKYKNCKIIIK
mgnify:CR=1 FL=1